MSEITQMLDAVVQGDQHAAERLLPLVYQELRRLARQHMGQERHNHTLQATALVHEAYLRLVSDRNTQWNGKAHFFCAAAEAIRRILIEHARRKNALRHGGGVAHVAIDEDMPEIASPVASPEELLDLSEALDLLAREDPAKAQLVKLRCFAGLSLDEASVALGISRATAYRQWDFARAWLRDAITSKGGKTTG